MDADDGQDRFQDDEPTDASAVDVDAIDVLGHEIRLETIEVLADERREAWLPRGLSFSELFDAVDVDDSGKFNYHLDKLRGTYVDEFEGTYVLTNAGFQIAGAIRAGTLGGGDDLERRETLERTCVLCDDQLEGIYEHGYFRLRCDTHGHVFASTLPPAAVRNRDVESIVDLAEARATDNVRRVRAGGCPHCWGQASITAPAAPSDAYVDYHDWDDEPEPRHDEPEPAERDSDQQVIAEASCDDCGMGFWLPVSVLIAEHPAVVAYYHDHDAGADGGYLDLAHVTGSNGIVVDDDPVRIRVDVHAAGAGETLVVTVDETTTVVDQYRRPADDTV
jgi:hypothetical protein